MASEQAPAYQWYVKDWRSSRKVQKMTFQQRGMYREMLDEQWEEMSLPDDHHAVADLLGGAVALWAKEWPVLRACFVVVDAGRIQNQRLEKERVKQRNRRDAGARGGDSSGKSRRGEVEAKAVVASSKPTDVLQAKSADSRTLHLHLPVAIADCHLQGASAVEPQVQHATVPTRPDAGSKRPIFTGQRLTVFGWQLDNCERTLGDNAMEFDLHEFFFALDEAAVSKGLVIPAKGGWEWLQSQLVAEARRRGIPLQMASAAALGKQTTRLAAAVQSIKLGAS